MKTSLVVLSLLMSFSLPSCSELFTWEQDPAATVQTVPTVPTETTAPIATVPETTVPETTQPIITGWYEENGYRYYYDTNGIPAVGWTEIDGTGYYFYEDGTMAVGEAHIDGKVYHFTSQGRRVILVNPWNYIPDDYVPDLVYLPTDCAYEGQQVDKSCYEDLVAMVTDCNRICPQAKVVSSYRSHDFQTRNYNNKVQYYVNQGYSLEAAQAEAATIIAVPGTSEHQLGLAVDIIDTRSPYLEWHQADLPAQQWLMENCWKYGFILRYPQDKIDVTGIIYEPWHYRYVGRELAAELHECGLTLEEYLQSLTPAVG